MVDSVSWAVLNVYGVSAIKVGMTEIVIVFSSLYWIA